MDATLNGIRERHPEATWAFVSETDYRKLRIGFPTKIQDLPVVAGVNSFKLFGFDIISHPYLRPNEFAIYDSKGRLIETGQLN